MIAEAGREIESGAPSGSESGSPVGTRLAVALICMGLSALAVVPFFFFGYLTDDVKRSDLKMPVTHDMRVHYDQMRSFHEGLRGGRLYPRWEEGTNRGFGAPTFSYYPPGIYYVTSFFFYLAGDWTLSLLYTHLILMIASGAAVFVYARRFMSTWPAVAAMAAYIILPYHLVDQYQRGAIAELLGFVWMPLMLLFASKISTVRAESPGESLKTALVKALPSVVGLGFAYGAFLWSHPPTAYQFSMAFGIYALTIAFIDRDWRSLLLVGVGIGLGLALAGAYILPGLLERDLVPTDYIERNWPYHGSYVFVHDLPHSEGHRMYFFLIDMIWLFGVVALVFAAAAFKPFRAGGAARGLLRRQALSWVMVGAFVSFMMTIVSKHLGVLIPGIETGVFTWRMLAISSLMVALMAGACAEIGFGWHYSGLRLRRRLLNGAVVGFVLIGGTIFSFEAVVAPMYYAPIFEPRDENITAALIPREAAHTLGQLPRDMQRVVLSEGAGIVWIQRWAPEVRRFTVTLNRPERLFIRTFAFPGWTAFVGGREVELKTGHGLKNLEIELEAGEHHVTLEFRPTPVRRVAGLTTVGAAILSLLLLCATWVVRRKGRSGSAGARNDPGTGCGEATTN